MTTTALDTLLEAAILAPSGDNTQPWRFTVDRGNWTILLDVDESRDPSPMNARQRMSRISLGAALENIVRTCQRNGWHYQIDNAQPDALIRLTLEETAESGTIDPLLSARTTNRRVYEGGPLSADCVARLQPTTETTANTRTVLITDPEILARLVALIARADALILGTKPIRDAFLAKVRFDAPVNEAVSEGLSLGSLEVGAIDRLTLRMMRVLPMPDGLLRLFGARQVFTRVATRLASSASGMYLITSTDPGPENEIQIGRAWQDIWLRLEREKLAAQPMMSLIVLLNICDADLEGILSVRDRAAVDALLNEFRSLTETLTDGLPAVLMRFGIAPAPQSRVGRMKARELSVEL